MYTLVPSSVFFYNNWREHWAATGLSSVIVQLAQLDLPPPFFLAIPENPSYKVVEWIFVRSYNGILRFWLSYISERCLKRCACTLAHEWKLLTPLPAYCNLPRHWWERPGRFPRKSQTSVKFLGDDDIYFNSYGRNRNGGNPCRSTAFSKSHEPCEVINWRRGDCRRNGSRDLSVIQFPRTRTPPPTVTKQLHSISI